MISKDFLILGLTIFGFVIWEPRVMVAQDSTPPTLVAQVLDNSASNDVFPLRTLQEELPAKLPATEYLHPSDSFEPVWVWSKNPGDSPLSLRQYFWIETLPAAAELQVAVDDEFKAIVNGDEILNGSDWQKIQTAEIAPLLHIGRNELLLECRNSNASTPAGAIAAIRMRFGDRVLLVGTSNSTTATYQDQQIMPEKMLLLSADAGPWKIFTREPSKYQKIRREVKKLLHWIDGQDVHLSSKAVGYLAHLALDEPSLNLIAPAFTLTPNTRVHPHPSEDILLPFVSRNILRMLDDSNPNDLVGLQKDAAIAALTVLISKSNDTQTILDLALERFCQACDRREHIQLAVLQGLVARLQSDKQIFENGPVKVQKSREDRAKEIETAQAELEKILKDIDRMQSRLVRLKTVGPTDPGPDLSQFDKAIEQFRIQLTRRMSDFTDTASVIDDLKVKLADIADASVSDAARRRLDIIESFLRRARLCELNPIGKSLIQHIQEFVDRLRRQYDGITSHDSANLFFTSVTSIQGTGRGIEFGALTSAGDRPASANRTTSGDRPGVSITAPNHPNLNSRLRPIYPLTDDRGLRVHQVVENTSENEFRVPPGGAGAKEPN